MSKNFAVYYYFGIIQAFNFFLHVLQRAFIFRKLEKYSEVSYILIVPASANMANLQKSTSIAIAMIIITGMNISSDVETRRCITLVNHPSIVSLVRSLEYSLSDDICTT